jgi:hypothetical protein
MCTTWYNIKPLQFIHTVYLRVQNISHNTVTIYSHNYHRLVFIKHTNRVLCEVATQFHTLFTDTCRPGISPGPVRTDILWGTGFPARTAVPPHQCSILIFIFILMQSEGQAYKLSQKAILCPLSVAAPSNGCMQHRFGHASRSGALLTA